jgi:hypothetical protein
VLHRLPNKVHKQLFGRHKLGFRAAGAGLPRSVATAAAAVTVLPASGGGSGGSGGPVSIVLCSHCLRQLQGLPQLGPVEGGGRFGRNLSQHLVGVCATSGSVPASDGQDKVTDR